MGNYLIQLIKLDYTDEHPKEFNLPSSKNPKRILKES